MSKPLIILGSARKDGNTKQFIDRIFEEDEYELIDLLDHKLYSYNYLENYPSDDEFLEILKMFNDHSMVIWATPVYWYAMSSVLKKFFDRFTDITHDHEEVRQELKGCKTNLLSIGSSLELPVGFEVPFRDTAIYFDMVFQSSFYCPTKYLGKKSSIFTKIKQELVSD